MLTDREKEIVLTSLALARGILIRFGEEGHPILVYQKEIAKAWGMMGKESEQKQALLLAEEILEEINSSIAKFHPDWVDNEGKINVPRR